ncbi:MAG: acyl-CoA thioesterase-1 [Rubritalea sp.]|jgi:acyl-CoA thioesterase-1|tara:strand:+ start:7198 stop:7893 length:696 start_codon:yes stop_codon:yes gene_type:complete
MVSAFLQTASHIIYLSLFSLISIISLSVVQAHEKDNAETKVTTDEITKRRIVFLGDSITAGFGLEKSTAYPALIQELAKQQGLTWKCINAGLSGDTTNGGARRVKLLVRRPLDLIIIALGGNDGLRGIAPAVTQENLLEIIVTIQKQQPKAKIILAGIEVPANMGANYKKKFLGTFTEVARKTKVSFYPSLIEGISGDPKLNQPDMIHPNQDGQKVIATKLFKQIQTTFTK